MTAGTTERIAVIIQAFTKRFHQGMNQATGRLKHLGTEFKSFNGMMALPMKSYKQLNEGMAQNFSTGGKVAFRIRQLTHGMRGFRMEMLGVMFFGMMINRIFMGMLQPALDLVGLFDLLNVTLGVVFLPIAMALLDILLPIMIWFIELPEPVKMVIGVFAVLGVIIGGFLFLFGSFMLGFGSMILAFGPASMKINTFAKALKKAGDLTKAPFNAIVKFTRKGWAVLSGNLSKLVNAGKGVYSTVASKFTDNGTFAALQSNWTKLNGWAKAGITIIVTFLVAVAGWKLGQQIADWTYEDVGRGFMETIKTRHPFGAAAIESWAVTGSLINRGLEAIGMGGGSSFNRTADDLLWRPSTVPDEGLGDTFNITNNITANNVNVDEISKEIGDTVERELNSRSRSRT